MPQPAASRSERSAPAESDLRPDTHVIRDVGQLRTLRSPARQQALAALELLSPCSVNELAGRLDMAAESLYYHVHRLVDVGLVRAAGSRRAGRRREVLYRPVASRIVVDEKERSPEFIDALADVARAALRAAERHHVRALEHEKTLAGGSREGVQIFQLCVRLTPKSAQRVRTMLEELVSCAAEHHDPSAESAYWLTSAISRVPEPPSDSPGAETHAANRSPSKKG